MILLRPCCLAGLALLLLSQAPGAAAVELMAGGYGIQPWTGEGTMAADGPASLGLSDDGSAVVLDFTPRGSGLLPPGQADSAPRVRFELGLTDAGSALPEPAEDRGPSWLRSEPAALSGLSLGGALQWSEWSLGGGFARSALLGGQADLMSATVGYGALSASLAYGETERAGLPAMDVLMLSTDVAAWSWLTLESDLALGSADAAAGETESVAVGRLGVRLNF